MLINLVHNKYSTGKLVIYYYLRFLALWAAPTPGPGPGRAIHRRTSLQWLEVGVRPLTSTLGGVDQAEIQREREGLLNQPGEIDLHVG